MALLFGLPPIAAVDDAEKDRQDRAHQLAVPGQAIANLEGQTQHPLAHGDRRQDLVDQTSGGVHHAPSHATGAEGTSLAGEGHDALVRAVFTPYAQEACGQDATVKVGAQLFLDVGGKLPIR